MKAICGKVDTASRLPPSAVAAVRQMCALLERDGGADSCLYLAEQAALAAEAPSIAAPGGIAEPMRSEDGTISVACSGAICNYDTLKHDLAKRGHRFRTGCHAEVIVHAYEEVGESCASWLRGPFAFAVWDSQHRRLVLARDHLGQRPLAYATSGTTVTFASEARALAADQEVDSRISPTAVVEYLRYGYVPSPETSFSGIKRLPAAHVLVAESGNVRTMPYWAMDFARTDPIAEEEASERLLDLVRESVRLRLTNGVRLGALLSGGVDSTLAVALTSALHPEPLVTFCFGFREAEWDERAHARHVADVCNTEHHEVLLGQNLTGIVADVINNCPEPYADPSVVPTSYIAKMAAQQVDAVVLGDGGDDLFGGYLIYPLCLSRRPPHRSAVWVMPLALGRAPTALRRPATRAANRLLQLAPRPGPAIRKLRRWVEYLGMTPPERHRLHMTGFSDQELHHLLSPAMRQHIRQDGTPYHETAQRQREHLHATTAGVNQLIATDLATYLPDELCVKVGIAAKASGLEMRSPLLDHKIAEFAASLPPELKLNGGQPKYILKRLVERMVPDADVWRAKRGFGIPLAEWLRGELREMAQDTLTSSSMQQRGLFDGPAVQQLLREHASGLHDHARKIWRLLMLELWLRRHAGVTYVRG